jgi:N-acetylmuramoyl-L-alanine amidase
LQAQDYSKLSALALLELCCFREARGEPLETQRAQMWSVRNRVLHPCWWNESKHPMPSLWHATILKPWQYSSFNENDPNSKVWPHDTDPIFIGICRIASPVFLGSDTVDPTEGAQYYHDTSIGWPKGWGSVNEYIHTLDSGRLRFYRHGNVNASSFAEYDSQ